MTSYIPYTELHGFIISQIATGSTFAVCEHDSSEQIFIPSQLARMQNLVPGDRIMVRAIPNRREGGAKWFAVFAAPAEVKSVEVKPAGSQLAEALANLAVAAASEPAPEPTPTPEPEPAPKPSVDWFARAKGALVKLGDVATSAEIADECGTTTQFISFYLRALHHRGEICRAGVRSKSDQQKDSLVYWGSTLDDLIPAGIVGDK